MAPDKKTWNMFDVGSVKTNTIGAPADKDKGSVALNDLSRQHRHHQLRLHLPIAM
jgi:hypothetical protein